MLDPGWVFFGAALGLAGSVRYAVAVAVGQARPHLVTWTLWAAVPLIALLAQVGAGVGHQAVLTAAAGLGPLVVVVTGLVTRRGVVQAGRFDVACGVVALCALGVWLGLGHAGPAVVVAVIADGVAALPTVRKAWRDPHSENALFYVLVGVGATVTLLTGTSGELAEWVFAGYMLALATVLVGVIAGRRGLHRRRE